MESNIEAVLAQLQSRFPTHSLEDNDSARTFVLGMLQATLSGKYATDTERVTSSLELLTALYRHTGWPTTDLDEVLQARHTVASEPDHLGDDLVAFGDDNGQVVLRPDPRRAHMLCLNGINPRKLPTANGGR